MNPNTRKLKPQQNPCCNASNTRVATRRSLTHNGQYENLNRISAPTSWATGKRKTPFQPSISRQSIFHFPNNWRKGKSRGTRIWESWNYVNKEVMAQMPQGGIKEGRIPDTGCCFEPSGRTWLSVRGSR